MKKYYSMDLNQDSREASVQIYGDITSRPWMESDVSAYLLSKQIAALDVDTNHVYLNSYGGEVAEGWAIYNALRRHPAQIHTYADGFVCSIASVIFMAGTERTMSNVSALMIHNPWTYASGNAADLRKSAEELETLGELSAKSYLRYVNISEDELKEMLDAETWITPEEAVRMGFATDIAEPEENGGISQSVRRRVFDRLTAAPAKSTAEAPAAPSGMDPEEIYESIKRRLAEDVKSWTREGGEACPVDLMKFLNAL